jgi:hypothetical protein
MSLLLVSFLFILKNLPKQWRYQQEQSIPEAIISRGCCDQENWKTIMDLKKFVLLTKPSNNSEAAQSKKKRMHTGQISLSR